MKFDPRNGQNQCRISGCTGRERYVPPPHRAWSHPLYNVNRCRQTPSRADVTIELYLDQSFRFFISNGISNVEELSLLFLWK